MIADDMRVALHREVRWLCTARYAGLPIGILPEAGQRSYPICQTVEYANGILRFEVDRDHEADLLEWMHRNSQLQKMPWELQGPYQFMGVDVYLVPNLPAPGWRIINPMRKP